MRKSLKILLTAVVAALLLAILVLWFQNRSLDKRNQLQSVELSLKSDSVRQFRTKAGEYYGQIQAVEIEKRSLKESLELSGIEIKNLRQKDIKWRDIVQVLQFKLESAGHDSIVYLPGDTIRIHDGLSESGKKYEWSNKYLSVWGTDWIKTKDFFYNYQTGVKVIDTKPGKNKTLVTLSLTDTNAVITIGSQITVPYKTPFYLKPWVWGVAGLAGGYFIAK